MVSSSSVLKIEISLCTIEIKVTNVREDIYGP